MPLDSITLENYRCFRERQTARLAPLTLLVGENSTGKTSFMAMIRALWDIGYNLKNPDFKEDPYDLGSFDEIAHHRGARGSRADTFEAAVSEYEGNGATDMERYKFEVTFGKKGTTPVPIRRRYVHGDTWVEEHFAAKESSYVGRFKTERGTWEWNAPDSDAVRGQFEFLEDVTPLLNYLPSINREDTNVIALEDSPDVSFHDLVGLHNMVDDFRNRRAFRPFASAPVRSEPRRTYDPARTTPDPEGDYVPMYLARMFFENKRMWIELKEQLESFGKSAGLFDEVTIRPFGKQDSGPFQVQVRKSGGRSKGPRRNLIDVGYGVSQVLPVITELLIPDSLRSPRPDMFLFQQPEVHLHPSAQAALGTLFCQVAWLACQLIVETHSDHLLDRVRMHVRDGDTDLKPDDVSILFFEPDDLDVHIHSLRIDEEGNIVGAPDSYRSFFMEETTRSLGL